MNRYRNLCLVTIPAMARRHRRSIRYFLGERAANAVAAVFMSGLLGVVYSPTATAAPINYGDFSDIPPGSVMYLDVTETAQSPGDTEPLLGDGNTAPPLNPSIDGNKLLFDPTVFTATASGGTTDPTEGSVTFTLRNGPIAVQPEAMLSISISNSGQYSLQDSRGVGSATTRVDHSLALTNISVVEVDGVTLASPVSLPGSSTTGSDNFGLGEDVATPWNLDLDYDFNSALTALGVPFTFGATRIDMEITNSLSADSEASTTAFIDIQNLRIEVTSVTVPEPTSYVLALTTLCLVLRRRR